MIRSVLAGSLVRRKIVSGIVAGACLLTVEGVRTLAQESATIKGTVVVSDGSSAQGVQVVFKDLASQKEYSATTNASGEYSLSVPTNTRYQLVKAAAPDGRAVPIQSSVPIVARAAGVFNQPPLAIVLKPCAADTDGDGVCDDTDKCKNTAKGAKVDATGCTPTTPPADGQTTATPWYKRPGPIIGIVLGSAALIGLALSGDDDPVSPH